MKMSQSPIILWASLRVNSLYKLNRFEDSYAVSQEFSEWTTLLNAYPEKLEDATLNVPNFNKENRTR